MALLYKLIPGYPIVLGANRDERTDRPGLRPQQIRAGVWAGVDPTGGGTWLGLNDQSRVVTVANRHTDKTNATARSRGLLCLDLLQEMDQDQVVTHLTQEARSHSYNAFNLLVADPARALVATYGNGDLELTTLHAGLHLVPNTLPNSNSDPKVLRGRALIETPRDIEQALKALMSACRDHGMTADGSDAICVHGREGAALSSSLLAVHERGLSASRYLHAEGNPCQSDYRDYSHLLRDTPKEA